MVLNAASLLVIVDKQVAAELRRSGGLISGLHRPQNNTGLCWADFVNLDDRRKSYPTALLTPEELAALLE